VRVRFQNNWYSHIGELRVYGASLDLPAGFEPAPEIANAATLALNGGGITVSDTAGGFSPVYVNDGNPSTSWSSTNYYNPFVVVDLGKDFDVSTLTLQNRGDGCCAERLNHFEIHTSLDGVTFTPLPGGPVNVAPSHLTPSWYTVERRARYVKLVDPSAARYLHLGELQIHGWEVTGGTPSSDAPWL
jgi:hypothetical protein